MKILFVLTYYRPHVSGLTIYVERLAQALAKNGHQVTVLTSRYDRQQPLEETAHGVRIVRVPVLARLNKGVLMPSFARIAWREMGAHDVVSIHLPQVEASLATLLARLRRHKPVITYHCDLQMPPVWFGPAVDKITFLNNLIAGWLADTIVAYTEDFAHHSPVLRRFVTRGNRRGKVSVILPPVEIPDPTLEGMAALRKRANLSGTERVIGFAARFAHEKGADYLINALPYLLEALPDVRILFAGPYEDVIGETIWFDLQPLIKQHQRHLTFLGTLNPEQMADFFATCDVLTVASINNTESFGLVQVEAFMCGTPVVATNLPGVRQPVMMTGMGEIVPVADAYNLAQGILRVLSHPERFVRPDHEIRRLFDISRTVAEYERLFEAKRVR